MTAHTKLAPDEQMTIEEFLAYTDARPDGERWELIEGVAIMSPSPVEFHQVIVANILTYLMVHKQRTGASWLPMPGVGTRVPVSPRSLPQPDVFVKEAPATPFPVTEDALVLFEVLSKSNTKADQAWRRKVYASVANCRHYVTVSLKAVEVVAYDRGSPWNKRTVASLNDSLDLPAIGVSIPLTDIYRWTPLGDDTH
ncbi:MAG: Uma2 family endonuclease [Hyphomicrobiaceae bacterium]